MTRVGVRRATQEDKPLFLEWLSRNADKNLLDPDVLTYPATAVLCAFDADSQQPLLFMPVQTVPVCESLAPNPDAADPVLAKCLEKLLDVVLWDCRATGKGQVHFESSDERLRQVSMRHGFKTIGLPVMKAKV